ncbi:hypothetical protein VY88_28930 [Azospirillum thiophilum]|uniref:Uncharacterized protein n=1 Tax=Azospirillum thiophilum TaxID=528244 RepID=A0AAC9EYS7_9PROT|nr:hypothetical protein [Azospirillum thiophilum]ALG75607.1 hypothetical protein AL072_32260 [Azospirillum thiophilum]KJR62126.1 hypothetical protein VY88_28930 [Azospirillum thiophilum]
MSKTDYAAEIFNSSSLHLDIVDEFIAIAQSKLNSATSEFARDSLTDLLSGLTAQRETYRAVLATVQPITALAA